MKRAMMYSAAALVAMIGSSIAAAQTAPSEEPSVDSYLCTFAGKCGDTPVTQEVSKAAPATKGFRLARSGPQAQPSPTPPSTNAPAVKGFRLARTTAQPATTVKTPVRTATPVRRPAKPGYSRAPIVGATSVGLRTKRADLMIGFEIGSATMTSAGTAKARLFAQALMLDDLKAKRFRIEGHTDSLGNPTANLDLSRRRAQAVADFLIAQGVDRTRLDVEGIGAGAPLPNRRGSDPVNRRVEAELVS